jgi:type II secretory pathway component GspD/PulD (secretin)
LDPVTIEFSSSQTIKGLTIDFSENYPTEFYIDSDSGRNTYTNDTRLFVTNDVFNTTYLTITPVHFVNSDNHRTRINSITFGVGLLFTNNEIESLDLSQEVSYISEELPNTEFSVNILDPNDLFNVDNENSYTKYLNEGQEIEFSIGQTLEDGSIEYIKMPTMYLSRWNNTKHAMSFSATDRFVLLDAPYSG